MRYCYFLIMLTLAKPCVAQMLRSSLPVNYTSVGTYSQHFTDVFSFTNNQASLSQVKNISAGVYSERRYMLQDLKQLSMAISFPWLQGGAGVAADYTGFTDYNETHIGIAYGKSLGAKISLGIQFNYNHISVTGYGAAGAINIEIGTIFRLTDKISAGCHVYNPVGGKFGKNSGEKLASVYSFGLGYDASEKLFIASDIIKEENQPVNITASLHYAFIKQFFIRGGISSGTGSYFAGAGILWSNIRLDIAAGWHPQTGATPSLLLIFRFAENKTANE